MMSSEYNFFKIDEIKNYQFYQVPKGLFEYKLYRENLSLTAKIIYSFLLDRIDLSRKNGWYDEEKYIYLIFTRLEIHDILGISLKTVVKAFKELNEIGLIKEKRQGLGKPNLIYISKLKGDLANIEQEVKKMQIQNCNNYNSVSEKITTKEMKNLQLINTNNINTEKIDHQELDAIKEKCRLNDFSIDEKGFLSKIIERLYYLDNLKIGKENICRSKIAEKLNYIQKDDLVQLLNIKKNNTNIKNVDKYFTICLYNNLGNKGKNIEKERTFNRYRGRKYSEKFLESFYDNI